MTVTELLSLPVLERGRPEVLAGKDLDSREVRWVHTSEIYEIAPLLKGGEVLLTTGLGLVGASAPELHAYAASLAERSVAALVLELGRTFAGAPDGLVAGARASGLPLITLRGIVPFVEITEAVHALLISDEVALLRLAHHVDSVMSGAVLAGGGLAAILREAATLAACEVRLYADDGHLVASSTPSDLGGGPSVDGRPGGAGLPGIGPRGTDPRGTGHGRGRETAEGFPRALVELRSRPWGYLESRGPRTSSRTLITERAATAVSLELSRSGPSHAGWTRQRVGALLLRDIFGRQYSSADEITGRAAALGFSMRPGGRVWGLCLAIDANATARLPMARATDGHGGGRSRGRAPSTATTATSAPAPTAITIVASAAEQVLGPCLVAELDGSYLIAAAMPAGEPRGTLELLADAIDRELPTGRAVGVTGGVAVTEILGLTQSLRVAREASILARRLHSDMRTLLATDMGVQRLISRFATDPELASFVGEQLGPLLDYDAAHGRELVRTLDTLLACGLSKAAAAERLHIRRQTLYQRLATIDTLLGGLDLGARERRTSLDLALVGWRLRTAGAVPTGTTPGGPAVGGR